MAQPGTFLYKPPTYVVTRSQPYLTLVTAVDGRWAHDKFKEVQYEFSGRVIYHNPYWGAVYSGYDNEYPVGMQWGLIDPAFVPLTGFNVGCVADTNTQSVTLTLPQGAAAGSLILLGIVDTTGGYVPATPGITDSQGNEYATVFNFAQAPFAIAASLIENALGAGATLTYMSTGPASLSSPICVAAACITGGVQTDPFDPDATIFANGYNRSNSTVSVTAGTPTTSNVLYVAFARIGAEITFAGDAAHGWTNLQQAAAGGAGAALCSSFQTGPVLDPGVSAPLVFSPYAGTTSANWGAAIITVRPTKPMVGPVETGSWA